MCVTILIAHSSTVTDMAKLCFAFFVSEYNLSSKTLLCAVAHINSVAFLIVSYVFGYLKFVFPLQFEIEAHFSGILLLRYFKERKYFPGTSGNLIFFLFKVIIYT